MQFVLFNVKRSDITFGLQDTGTAFLYGEVEQTAAHQIYQSVRRDTGSVFRKKLRMLLDERYYIVEFLLRWLETALSVGRHYELVATDTPSVAVRADIRRVAKAVPPVQAVTRINKHVLNVQSAQIVVVCKVSVSHIYLPNLMSVISRFISASK